VAGRALAFSDREIVRMAKEQYVAVACDDWYQRRREDAEGRFFKQVSDQSPQGGNGTGTRQGIYLLTASGKLLGYKNAGQNPGVMRDFIRSGLSKWGKLAEAERTPGAVKVGEPGKLDTMYARTPPENGLIVNVHARLLEHADAAGTSVEGLPKAGSLLGGFADAQCKVGNGDEASRDHLWLTEAEWKSLIPKNAKVGERSPVPPAIVSRILRFHLIDNTRGEPPMWRREDVRKGEMSLVVESATPAKVTLRLEGVALLATDASVDKAKRGYDARLLGYIEYDPTKPRVTRFDVVAVGDHCGEGTFTRGAREGRKPMGVAFELATGGKPGDLVPPQAAREVGAYFRAED
jgi:hypothetical protein